MWMACTAAQQAPPKFEATGQVVKAAKEGRVCDNVIGSVGEERRRKRKERKERKG
jgi:hypothetical protein